MTNKQELREAAERATPGKWRRASTRFNGITATPLSLGGEEVMLAGASEKRDAEFISAANPAAVLALLDELEAAEKRVAELEASHGNLREAMAGIHNTIAVGGAYTSLAAILNASKRAYEESANAAGIRINGEG